MQLHDTKGLRYLAELIAHPGVERHAFDLVDRVEGVPSPADPTGGSWATPARCSMPRRGPAYRHRVEQLRADADDALAAGQLETAEAKQDELDQLVAQLAQAFGLGGRDRRAARRPNEPG